jgi:hypothetical protein
MAPFSSVQDAEYLQDAVEQALHGLDPLGPMLPRHLHNQIRTHKCQIRIQRWLSGAYSPQRIATGHFSHFLLLSNKPADLLALYRGLW